MYTNKVILNVEGSGPQVWQVECNVRVLAFCQVVVDGGVDDDILTLLPVNGGSDGILVAGLKSYASSGEYGTLVRRPICTYSRRP